MLGERAAVPEVWGLLWGVELLLWNRWPQGTPVSHLVLPGQLPAACSLWAPAGESSSTLQGHAADRARSVMLYSSGPERLFVCLGPGLFSQLAGQPSAKCVLKLAFAFFLIHSFMCLYVCSVHHVCIYIPMYVDTCMRVRGFTCVCVHGNQRLTSGIFFGHSPPCVLRQGLSLRPRAC